MLFGKLLRKLLRRPGSSNPRGMRPGKRQLAVENLEEKRLLALLTYTPANGNDNELTIEINEQGAFGWSDDLDVTDPDNPANNAVNSARYDPVGDTYDVAGTTYASGIAIGFGDYNGDRLAPELDFGSVGERHFITAGFIGGSRDGNSQNQSGRFLADTDEPDELFSEFLYPNDLGPDDRNDPATLLHFQLVQRLVPIETNGTEDGVVLEQTYTITNESPITLHFDIIRYMDADLYNDDDDGDTFPGPLPGNGGGMQEQGLKNLKTVYTTFDATNNVPFGDPTLVTIRDHPIDAVGIPPQQNDRWELGRGSRPTPDLGYTNGAVTGAGNVFKVDRAGDDPVALPRTQTLLRRIVEPGDIGTGNLADDPDSTQYLADAVTAYDWALTPPGDNPDDDRGSIPGGDRVDSTDPYDVAMAMRNVYTQIGPGEQIEYYTQTVWGKPPLSQDRFGRVSGTVYEDTNSNGVLDVGIDQPVRGAYVYLDRGPGQDDYVADGVFNEFDWKALSQSDGSYILNRIEAGNQDITLHNVMLDGTVLTIIQPPANPQSVNVINGAENGGNDFLVESLLGPTGMVSGLKFLDLNGNGVQDGAREVALSGWTIYHDTNDNQRLDGGESSAVTDAAGNYSLIVPVGAGQVIREAPPSGLWTPRGDVALGWDAADSSYSVTVAAAGDSLTGYFFANEPAPFAIEGIKWEDEFFNRQPDSFERRVDGVTVFVDVDQNGLLDVDEPFAVTGADGAYRIDSDMAGREIGPGTYDVREVIDPAVYDQTWPIGGVHVIEVVAGETLEDVNFGNRLKRASVSGRVLQDPSGAGLGGVFVYVDMNRDGYRSLSEPGAVTARNGTYTILDVLPGGPTGDSYIVRLDPASTLRQTDPIPKDSHDYLLDPGDMLTGINFSVSTAVEDLFDYGDAPSSYPTTGASGAVHGILADYMLGTVQTDGESDGQPSPDATGDDSNNRDDEDGVQVPELVVGQPATIRIFFTQDGTLADRPVQGYIQGWIDFDGDGNWNDPGEQILTNYRPVRGNNEIAFTVPAGASVGTTFARFRLGYEWNLGVGGSASKGEVEDYAVTVRATASLPDLIGRTSTGDWRVSTNTGSSFVDVPGWDSWVEAEGWHDVMTGDFNNDGLTDVVGRRNNGEWYMSLNNGSGFDSSVWGRWNPAPGVWDFVTTGDFDNNGYLDILGHVGVNGKWFVALNHNGVTFRTYLWGTWLANWSNIVVGNFTGDDNSQPTALPDVLGRDSTTGRWWIGENLGTSFAPMRSFGTLTTARTWVDLNVGDVNGDNLDDIVTRNLLGNWVVGQSNGTRLVNQAGWAGWSPLANWTNVTLADFTGDGLPDLMGRNENNDDWQIGRNTGTSFNSAPYGDWSTFSSTWLNVLFADFTGDGLLDVAGRSGTTDEWYVGRNTLSAFDTDAWLAVWASGLGWRDVNSGMFD